MDYYPDAKVLLSVRDGEAWVRSMRADRVGDLPRRLGHPPRLRRARGARPAVARYVALMRRMTWEEGTGVLAGDTSTDEGLAARDGPLERERQAAPCPPIACSCGIPAKAGSRCAVPRGGGSLRGPLPRLNDTPSFREGIIGGALDVVNEWWDARERPATEPARRRAELSRRDGPAWSRRRRPERARSAGDRARGAEHGAGGVECLHGDVGLRGGGGDRGLEAVPRGARDRRERLRAGPGEQRASWRCGCRRSSSRRRSAARRRCRRRRRSRAARWGAPVHGKRYAR